MASLDDLPPDQRAVLELVLGRRRDYDAIARMLSIDRAAVRDRARAALDALGPRTTIFPERRHLITDYLLGQLPQSVAAQTRERLARDPDERAWTTAVASELAPLASEPLPEIPDESQSAVPAERTSEPEPQPGAPRRSRLLGAMLLGLGAVAAVLVVLVFVVNGSSSKHNAAAPKSAGTTGSSTSANSASTTATPVADILLRSPTNHKGIAGVAEILRRGSATAVAIVGEGMAPNTKRDAYAVWLCNARSDCVRLGFVNPGVGKDGRLETAGGLPANAGRYKELLVSLETTANPPSPTHVVLEGLITGLS